MQVLFRRGKKLQKLTNFAVMFSNCCLGKKHGKWHQKNKLQRRKNNFETLLIHRILQGCLGCWFFVCFLFCWGFFGFFFWGGGKVCSVFLMLTDSGRDPVFFWLLLLKHTETQVGRQIIRMYVCLPFCLFLKLFLSFP